MNGDLHLYHGSAYAVMPGTILKGRGAAYERDWSNTDFYGILEKYRPNTQLAHKSAVFLVGDPDDIDSAGGATDWCLEVSVSGEVSRHDLNWSTQISCLLSDGYLVDSKEVRDAALAYWEGREHKDSPVWEYLAREAKVLRCAPYESFEVVLNNAPRIAARFVSVPGLLAGDTGEQLPVSFAKMRP